MTAPDFDQTAIQVRAARDGDRGALEDLFARYLPRVARIAAARMGRSWRELGLDDDVVQETFLAAAARRPHASPGLPGARAAPSGIR